MNRTLVIQLARFGDLIQTKRLLASLVARADTEVHLCLDVSLEKLARIVYPGVILHPIRAHGTGLSGPALLRAMLDDNRRTFAELIAQRFDRVFNLNFSGLNFRVAALFDPDSVRGYRWRDGQEVRGAWPSLVFRFARERRLAANLVDVWSAFAQDRHDENMLPPESVNPPAAPGGKGVGIVLAGRESRRSLPPEVLAGIASAVWQRRGRGRIVLLGSGSEAPAARAVLRALPPRLHDMVDDLAGKTDWAGLVDAVSGLDTVLTPDTGTMHLAAHLGVPVTAFFLSSAWCTETGPYGAGHVVHQAMTDCAPCLESAPCPHGLQCLDAFRGPQFLRYLSTGRSEHLPPRLTTFASRLDELGTTFEAVAGPDPQAGQRTALRSFLATHLHQQEEGNAEISQPSENPATLENLIRSAEWASRLYLERDWMPETLP